MERFPGVGGGSAKDANSVYGVSKGKFVQHDASYLPQMVTSMEKWDFPYAFSASQEYRPASLWVESPMRSLEVTRSSSRISVVLDLPGTVRYSRPSFFHLILE